MSAHAGPAAAVAHRPHTAAMLRMQVRVEQRIFWRNRSGVFFTFVLPLLLLAFLGPFADSAMLVPGIAALAVASTAFQGLAIQVAMHRDQGVLKRIMATPLPPTVLLAGKVISIALVVAIELAVVVLIGTLAFGMQLPSHPAALVGIVVLGIIAFVACGFAVASAVRTSESAPALTNAIYLPMLFVSGVFHSIEELPVAVRAIGELLPLAHLVRPLRGAWTGAWTVDPWIDAAALAAWALVAAWWTVRKFRWEPAGEG